MNGRFLERLLTPHLDWLEVEISSRCNAACSSCPHTIFTDVWQRKLMDFALFESLQPVLPATGMTDLQGWGEPLAHPEFFRFMRVRVLPISAKPPRQSSGTKPFSAC